MAKIAQETLNILGRMEIEGDCLKLTCGQLDPKDYKKVDGVLQAMGGKWHRKRGGHLFPTDPSDKLEMVLLTGEILSPQDFGYYPTPSELAQELLAMADLEDWHSVLEPQAGQGALAEAAARIVPKENIQCVELPHTESAESAVETPLFAPAPAPAPALAPVKVAVVAQAPAVIAAQPVAQPAAGGLFPWYQPAQSDQEGEAA